MASRSYHHQTISSLNPAWCLRPLPFSRGRSLRGPSDADCTDTCSSSTFSSTQHHLLVAEEPSSPKIGCMGQIRRGKASFSSPATARSHQQQYLKMFRFKRILSGRSVASPHSSARVGDDRGASSLTVAVRDVSEMDPPLPVVRREDKDVNAVGLWSRRCRGLELEGLQLQKPRQLCACTHATVL